MITVTSAEKNRIEGQMKTALPLLNNQVGFEVAIENGNGRSRLTFKKDGELHQLPIFYITPSTDDSDWEVLTDHIENETESQGIFIIQFHTKDHLIHNAVTYALTNHDLYEKRVLAEMCRLCSFVDLEPYKMHILDTDVVQAFYDKLCNQGNRINETEEEETMVKEEAIVEEETVALETSTEEKQKESKEKVAEDVSLDLDLTALINDCFGIF